MAHSQPDPTHSTPYERLLKFFSRESVFGNPHCECCVEFLDAKRGIESLGSGPYQWIVLPVIGLDFPDRRWSSRYLIICFSNPDETGITNHICYCVPLFLEHSAGSFQLLACFAPHSIIPLTGALNWKDGALDTDEHKDWLLFWRPVNHYFWPEESVLEFEDTGSEDQKLEAPPATITEIPGSVRSSISRHPGRSLRRRWWRRSCRGHSSANAAALLVGFRTPGD